MKSCRLCSDQVTYGRTEVWNEPLFESLNFVVLPSLGALVEGWLLLVPKQHFICIGALPDPMVTEMQEMKHIICLNLQKSYGQVCAFEHGPSKANCSVGCGVDHAHLHFVPVAFDLSSAATPYLPEKISWSDAGPEECRAAFNRGEDYLYLEQPIGAGRIATGQNFGSQVFRRAIAAQVGAVNQFNWREYPQLQNVSATIEEMQAWDRTKLAYESRPEVAA